MINLNIRDIKDTMKELLIDRTTENNIIWATDNHKDMGEGYQLIDSIELTHVDKSKGSVIIPRVDKDVVVQKKRTKTKAEVFTPTWVIKKQNDVIEGEFKGLELEEYIGKTWLEITCGEGPYMCNRYDMVSGEFIAIPDRVGFLDRKLQRISREVDDHTEWLRLVTLAYQSSFGYEFQGDSLLIARENMLYTFIEYYSDKFDDILSLSDISDIAEIISYNVFQMDGLKYIIPLSDVDGEDSGVNVKIMDWDTDSMIEFKSLLGGDED